MTAPNTLYEIRRGMRGLTREWGRIVVLRNPGDGRVTIRGSGGRGAPGRFETTRSILFASTKWDTRTP